ncbi:hypothetical protein llap_7794 [Limosa lapponica baueri]|uniref:Uncharacterized protein n=1 Tax=Limosa lapponica baueri TaxID=1758121 RepID=A0A2I0U7G1_LIMLA|nr:hypothetical protein llap_7794 [Limosa lapponica baueri]
MVTPASTSGDEESQCNWCKIEGYVPSTTTSHEEEEKGDGEQGLWQLSQSIIEEESKSVLGSGFFPSSFSNIRWTQGNPENLLMTFIAQITPVDNVFLLLRTASGNLFCSSSKRLEVFIPVTEATDLVFGLEVLVYFVFQYCIMLVKLKPLILEEDFQDLDESILIKEALSNC